MPARRTSNEEKRVRGTDRPDRMRDEPDFPVVEGYPDPPTWLTHVEAIREWKKNVRILAGAGSLTEDNLSLLAHYCQLHAEIVSDVISGEKPTAADRTQLRLMATEFGFTPSSRSKAAPVRKDDEGQGRARLIK